MRCSSAVRASQRCLLEDRNDLRNGFAGAKDGFVEADALASIKVELNIRTHQTRAPTKALPIRYRAKAMEALRFAALSNPSIWERLTGRPWSEE